MSEEKTEPETRKPTPEEIEKMKANMIKYYTDNLPFLRVKAEHERLEAEIIESHARYAKAEVMLAQIYGPREPKDTQASTKKEPDKQEMVQPEEGAPKERPIHRTLKQD